MDQHAYNKFAVARNKPACLRNQNALARPGQHAYATNAQSHAPDLHAYATNAQSHAPSQHACATNAQSHAPDQHAYATNAQSHAPSRQLTQKCWRNIPTSIPLLCSRTTVSLTHWHLHKPMANKVRHPLRFCKAQFGHTTKRERERDSCRHALAATSINLGCITMINGVLELRFVLGHKHTRGLITNHSLTTSTPMSH